MQNSRYPSTAALPHVDDSIDELADELLVDTSQDVSPVKKVGDVSPRGNVRQTSLGAANLAQNKPLPLLPQEKRQVDGPQLKKKRGALASKPANLKLSKKGKKRISKSNISSPQLIYSSSADRAHQKDLKVDPGSERVVGPEMKAQEAADLSGRVSTFIQHTAEQDVPITPSSRSVGGEKTGTPRKTGNEGGPFARAKKAFAGKLGNGCKKQAGKKSSDGSPLGHSADEHVGSEVEIDTDYHRHELGHHIAKGSTPQVQAGTDSRKIPRKPVPPSTRDYLKSLEDPFQERKDADGHSSFLPRPMSNHGTKAKAKRTSDPPLIPQDDSEQSVGRSSSQLTQEKEQTSNFCEMISGLAQHSDVQHFSSSPFDYSTPRTRLQPRLESTEEEDTAATLPQNYSSFDFRFEDETDDTFEEADVSPVEERSMSLKRKTAKTDLRAGSTEATKRAKRLSEPCTDEAALTANISKLRTHDGSTSLIKADQATGKVQKLKGLTKSASTSKGFDIFETRKGKAPMATVVDFFKKTRSQAAGKRHSTTTFASSASGRQTVAPTVGRGGDEDCVSLDELQMEGTTHKSG